MNKSSDLTTVLDVSKALGFDLLYQPTIGKMKKNFYPILTPSTRKFRSERKDFKIPLS